VSIIKALNTSAAIWFCFTRLVSITPCIGADRVDSGIPELDNLSCHAELSAIRIITMPITTKVIRYGVISPSGSSGGRSYPFECLFGFALSARVRHHRNRMPKTTSRDLVLMAAHYSGPCEPGNAARI
jgi:hypothetical protein